MFAVDKVVMVLARDCVYGGGSGSAGLGIWVNLQ
jgi:hypothetical protein